MADYIDREAVTKPLSDVCAECKANCEEFDGFYADCNQCYVHDAIAGIAGIPAADVRPVVHGKWIYIETPYANSDGCIVCSECGKKINIINKGCKQFAYCPNCGAVMAEKPTEQKTRVEPETPDTDPSKWISVKDRLPAEAGTYLVAVYIDDVKSDDWYQLVLMAWYNPKTDPYPIMGWTLLNEWYDMTNDLRDYITHWQPWPEPPEI